MTLELYVTARFKRDMRLMARRGLDLSAMDEAVDMLRRCQPLPEKYRDHDLSGDYKGFRECHIQPDWLLVYRVDAGALILTLARTGTHSDLF